MTPEDICAVLLAAVLHDIGQFPLAHDLEEIASMVFDHRSLGERIITDVATDPDGEFAIAVKLWGV
jgi:HD superfamily phosphohydrolase